MYEAEIFIVVFNKVNEIVKKEKIVSEIPNPFIFSQHLDKLKWLDNDNVNVVLEHNQCKDIVYSVFMRDN